MIHHQRELSFDTCLLHHWMVIIQPVAYGVSSTPFRIVSNPDIEY